MYVNKTFNKSASGSTSADYDAAASALATDIVDFLISSDDRITALTDGISGVLINGKIKLLIEGSFTSTNRTILFTVRNSETDLFNFYVGCQEGLSGDSAKKNSINLHIAISDGAFSVIIRNRRTAANSTFFTAQIIMLIAENDVTAVGYALCGTGNALVSAATTRNFATDTSLWNLADNTQSITVAKRLPYAHESTNANIATLSDKILLSDSLRVGDVPIIDCSTIVGDATYPFDGVTYYAIDDNTLISIGGE